MGDEEVQERGNPSTTAQEASVDGTPCPACGETEDGGVLIKVETGFDCDTCSYHEETIRPSFILHPKTWEALQAVMADFGVTWEDIIGAALHHKERNDARS